MLDGAKALAVPTKYGQTLKVTANTTDRLNWKSYYNKGAVWFSSAFLRSNDNSIVSEQQNDIAIRLAQVLNVARSLKPNFLNDSIGFDIESHLEFPRDWGLGSSSTLINNIAEWANVDPYKLLKFTFGGSGYDIACASHNKAITYQLLNDNQRTITEVNFNPTFSKNLYFVHLNKKQNSREGISRYRSNSADKTDLIKTVGEITESIIECNALKDFQELIQKHEYYVSKVIGLPTLQSKLFSDFRGSIKSLGAWGGDFILAASEDEPTDYFYHKGFKTIIKYEDMVLDFKG